MRHPLRTGVALAVVVLAGCGTPPPGRQAAPPAAAVQVDESANGARRTVAPGGTITVVLHSTYWRLADPSAPGVVAVASAPVVAGAPPGHGCVPGAGCGTVTATYVARTPGRATVSAHRSSCGEAMACTPAQSSWSLTVVVP